MDVKDDYGDESLGDDFDRALSETLATSEDDDREVNTPAQYFANLPWRCGLVMVRLSSYLHKELIWRTLLSDVRRLLPQQEAYHNAPCYTARQSLH